MFRPLDAKNGMSRPSLCATGSASAGSGRRMPALGTGRASGTQTHHLTVNISQTDTRLVLVRGTEFKVAAQTRCLVYDVAAPWLEARNINKGKRESRLRSSHLMTDRPSGAVVIFVEPDFVQGKLLKTNFPSWRVVAK